MAAEADPRGFLGGLNSGAILDEVQRLPILLSYFRELSIRKGNRASSF
jgi:hypothetical protein